MSTVPTREQADLFRDIGIAKASRGVDAVWKERALGYVREFAAYASEPFLVEDIREFAHGSGALDEPHNAKAWGPVIQKARKLRIIVPCGYRPARSSHCSPKVLWRRA